MEATHRSGPEAAKAGVSRVGQYIDDHGRISLDEIAHAFRMTKIQLAETVGLGREAVSKEARARGPKTQARVKEMLEIIVRVADWAGGEERAMAWYRSEPLPEFGGRTAEALVKSGDAAAVRDYLDHVALGGFA